MGTAFSVRISVLSAEGVFLSEVMEDMIAQEIHKVVLDENELNQQRILIVLCSLSITYFLSAYPNEASLRLWKKTKGALSETADRSLFGLWTKNNRKWNFAELVSTSGVNHSRWASHSSTAKTPSKACK